MSEKDTGGPAFPQPILDIGGGSGIVAADEVDWGGMTLRDYAAVKFGAALLAGGMIYGNNDNWLDDAFAKADAFIARREK